MDDDVGADNRTVPGYVAKYFLTGYLQAFDGSANLLDCFPDDDVLSNRMNQNIVNALFNPVVDRLKDWKEVDAMINPEIQDCKEVKDLWNKIGYQKWMVWHITKDPERYLEQKYQESKAKIDNSEKIL